MTAGPAAAADARSAAAAPAVDAIPAVAAVSRPEAAEPAAGKLVPVYVPAPEAFDIPADGKPAAAGVEAAVAAAIHRLRHCHRRVPGADRPDAFPVPEALRHRADCRRHALYLVQICPDLDPRLISNWQRTPL